MNISFKTITDANSKTNPLLGSCSGWVLNLAAVVCVKGNGHCAHGPVWSHVSWCAACKYRTSLL